MTIIIKMPKLSPTMEEGVIARWCKNIGDKVEAGDVLLEISTDKATLEHSVLDEGYLRELIVPQGGAAAVNAPIAICTETAEETYAPLPKETAPQPAPAPAPVATAPAPQPQPVVEAASTPAPRQEGQRVLVSPLARKLAQERNIDLSTLPGSGPGGRIVSRDLEKAHAIPQRARTTAPAVDTHHPLTPVRKVIATRLTEAKSSIPHFYIRTVIDAEPLAKMREQLKASGESITINDLIVKACAQALTIHPEINSTYNPATATITRKGSIDISIAVSVDGGLITPIVFDAASKSVKEISHEVRALAQKARDNKLKPSEFQGGSFTISNLGMYPVADFQAILNPPQTAILAVGTIRDVPVVRNGHIVPGKEMALTLSVDHRAIDGADAARFAQKLKGLLENPLSLLLG